MHPYFTVAALERLRARVDKNGPVPAHVPHVGACWIWQGAKNAGGYGLVFGDTGIS